MPAGAPGDPLLPVVAALLAVPAERSASADGPGGGLELTASGDGRLTYEVTPDRHPGLAGVLQPWVDRLHGRSLRTEVSVEGQPYTAVDAWPGEGRGELVGLFPGARVDVRTHLVNADGTVLREIADGEVMMPPAPAVRPAPRYEPPEPKLDRQWGLDLVHAPEAWALLRQAGADRAAPTVAVIDSANWVDRTELNPARAGSFDVRDGVVQPRIRPFGWIRPDLYGHGTGVAGIIGAAWDGRGIAGLVPGARIVEYDPFQDRSAPGGSGAQQQPSWVDIPQENVIAALDHLTGQGARVVNMSFGSPSMRTGGAVVRNGPELWRERTWAAIQGVQGAVDRARQAGVVLVAAAGNGQDNPELAGTYNFPASLDGVISVVAIDRHGGRTSYSRVNGAVDLAAPGGYHTAPFGGDDDRSVLTVGAYGEHDGFSGTSAAAPFVTGTVALMQAANPDLTPDQVRSILQRTAKDLGRPGYDPEYGFGLVQADAAVRWALDMRAWGRHVPPPLPRRPGLVASRL